MKKKTKVSLEDVLEERFFGGFIPGSLLGLLVGPRGIGKTTLGLQIAAWMGKHGSKAEVVTGEMPEREMRDFVVRLQVKKVKVHASFYGHNINDVIARSILLGRTEFLFVDSLQTTGAGDVEGDFGSRKQMEAVIARAANITETIEGVTMFFSVHTNKAGSFTNRRIINQTDVILQMERDKEDGIVLLRAARNRISRTGAKVRLRMTERGFVVAE